MGSANETPPRRRRPKGRDRRVDYDKTESERLFASSITTLASSVASGGSISVRSDGGGRDKKKKDGRGERPSSLDVVAAPRIDSPPDGAAAGRDEPSGAAPRKDRRGGPGSSSMPPPSARAKTGAGESGTVLASSMPPARTTDDEAVCERGERIRRKVSSSERRSKISYGRRKVRETHGGNDWGTL